MNIKFRGMINGNQWVYGFYSRCEDTHYISEHRSVLVEPETNTYENKLIPFIVDPKTVGQFTGLYDVDKKELFNNDIVEVEIKDGTKQIWTLEHVNFTFYTGYIFYGLNRRFHVKASNNICKCVKLIGNTHQHSELLKGE